MKFSDEPIRFRVSGGEEQTIPRSQEARLLRALWHYRRRVNWNDLYVALGSQQVPRCLHRLRHKWQVPIQCEPLPNAKGTGKAWLYHLGENVEVIGEGGQREI